MYDLLVGTIHWRFIKMHAGLSKIPFGTAYVWLNFKSMPEALLTANYTNFFFFYENDIHKQRQDTKNKNLRSPAAKST